jgi:site-specific DNA-methyltransferase (adenine-specific)
VTPYYEQDGITLYHGDSREILPQLPAGSVDLVLTSPPYNLGTTVGERGASLKARGSNAKWPASVGPGGLGEGYGTHDDAMPFEEYVAWQRRVLLDCWRLLSERGAIYYNHKSRFLNGECITPLSYNPGLPLRQVVIWDRAGGFNWTPVSYKPTDEWLVILARPAFRLRDRAASGVGTVWRIPPECGTPHPAPFPLGLAFRVLETTPAGTVLDPFAGWGTTLVAAKRLGRSAIGIELEERFCEMAAERIEGTTPPLPMEPAALPGDLFAGGAQ